MTAKRNSKPVLAPMEGVTVPSSKALARFRKRSPLVVEFWQRWGWGGFGNGFLWLVDPSELEETLDQWLGGPSPTRIPLGRTALGDLLYFRDLRERARELGLSKRVQATACDISVVDVRYKQVTVLATSFEELEEYFRDPAWLAQVLRKDLFDSAVRRLGPPEPHEIYGFVPALGLGGAEKASALQRVQADVHLEILFQL